MARPRKNTQNVKETTKAQENPAQEAESVEEVKTPDVETSAEEKTAAPTFTEEQVKAMIAEATAKAVADAIAKTQTAPQVVQVSADVEKVHFLWQAEVADDNVLTIGGDNSGYAPITGKMGEFIIPKSDLSRIMTSSMREWMRRRWLIVVSGLTDEEREIYGVKYEEGELLDRMAFKKMVEMEDKILDIYPKLCAGHREMVAKRYYEAYMEKNPHVRRDVVTKLNDLSVQLGSENGDFDPILEAMNEADRKHKK